MCGFNNEAPRAYIPAELGRGLLDFFGGDKRWDDFAIDDFAIKVKKMRLKFSCDNRLLKGFFSILTVMALVGCSTAGRQISTAANTSGNVSDAQPTLTATAASAIAEARRGTPEYDEFRRFYDEYFAAWNAAFPTNLDAPARFYAPDPGLVAYDPSPTREGPVVDGPIGWAGLREHFGRSIFPSLSGFNFNFAPEDDLRVWRSGDVAWASLIWRVAAQTRDGRRQQTDGRQTNVFERRDGRWVIVHEHASVPVPEGVTRVSARRVVPLGAALPNRDAEFQRMLNDYGAAWHAQNGNPPDWDRIAGFFAQDPDIVLIDASPFRPNVGFTAFRDNAQRSFYDNAAFWTYAVNPDVQAVRRGNIAWTTFTFHISARMKNGQQMEVDGRQTNVWERRDDRWLIVHEHGSVPLAQ